MSCAAHHSDAFRQLVVALVSICMKPAREPVQKFFRVFCFSVFLVLIQNDRMLFEGLFTTVTNVSFNEKTIRELIGRVHEEKARLVPGCSGCGSRCGRNDDYDMNLLWNAQEDIRSLKSLILFGVRGMAAYAHHAMMLGYADEEVNRFFAKALFAVGED